MLQSLVAEDMMLCPIRVPRISMLEGATTLIAPPRETFPPSLAELFHIDESVISTLDSSA
jgi:hypothetical protein